MNPEATRNVYPADFHFSIVATQPFDNLEALETVLKDHHVTSPLAPGLSSDKGSYITWRVTVHLESRDALESLTAALRAVPGVKMLL